MATFHTLPDYGPLRLARQNRAVFGPPLPDRFEKPGPYPRFIEASPQNFKAYPPGPHVWLQLRFDSGSAPPLPRSLDGASLQEVQTWLEAHGGSLLVPLTLTRNAYVSLAEDPQYGSPAEDCAA